MKIVSFRDGGRARLGVVLAGGVLDVARAAEVTGVGGLAEPDAFFGRGLDALVETSSRPARRRASSSAARNVTG